MSETTSNTNAPAWMAQLSGDLQQNKDLTSFSSISDLGKAFLDAKGKLGEAMFLPKNEQEETAFFGKLGRPDGPDKYQLDKPNLPEGMQYDKDTEAAFRAEAHKLGLSQKQMNGLFAAYNARQIAAYEAAAKSRADAVKSAEETLQKEWGNKFGENLELARRAVVALGGEKLKAELEKGLGNHPELCKVFALLGSRLADDKLVIGDKKVDAPKATGQFHYDNSPGMYKK